MMKSGILAWLLLVGVGFGQSDVQRQVDACRTLTTCNIMVPDGTSVVSAAWNLRDKTWLTIRGTGTVIWHFAADPPPSVCMDTIGSANVIIDGPTFALGNSSKRPDALWIHGRGSDSKSQSRLAVSNVKFAGWYLKTAVAFIAVENEMMASVDFENGVANTTSLFLSRANELNLSSPFGPVRVNVSAMTSTNHTYVNCAFAHDGHVGLVAPAVNDGVGLALGSGVHDLLIQTGSTSGGQRAAVMRVSGPDNRRIAIVAPNWESKFARHAIVIDGEVTGLSVDRGLLMADGPAIRVNGRADGLYLCPTEMLTSSIIEIGPTGRVTGFESTGFSGQ